LGAGDKVPADLRLFEVNGLECDESILTGESVPVEKSESAIAVTESPSLGDRINCAFMGTVCTKGKAKGIVVATGIEHFDPHQL
jgi:P-type E1-E2 ATPase